MRVCARCKSDLTKLAPFKPVAPVWDRLGDILRFPLRDGDWVRFVSWSAVVIVLRGVGEMGLRYAGFVGLVYGLPLLVAYYGMLVSYFYRVIAHAEDGRFEVPYWPTFDGLSFSMAWPVVQFGVVFLMSLWPCALTLGGIIVGDVPFGPALALMGLALMVSLAQMPMALLVLGVQRTVLLAANPLYIARQILKIPSTYFLSVAILLALTCAYGLIATSLFYASQAIPGTASIVVAVVLYPIDGLVQLYFLMVAGHLLGYVAYQERFVLAWWPKYAEDTVLRVGDARVRVVPGLFTPPST